MNIRIKFAKQGAMKFIGHLDIMRYFQKANRRAGIDVKYSEGYSPHQIMSFAAPLGVGVISRGEYFDMAVNGSVSPEEIKNRLNKTMADGMEIISCIELSDNAANCMSVVAAADYNVYFDEGIFNSDIKELIDRFYACNSIEVLKKTKKSEKIVDIKPLIYDIKYVGNGCIFMKVAQGSVANLKPELVFLTICNYANVSMPEKGVIYERLEMYADVGNESEKKLVALDGFVK